mmetsp:Transcript_10726/g.41672  ORF Transcript_10726/g.41672 Transcript_10726/m.41672 type:complete len:242 (-) Transcript_10726:1990-2715(-)
MPRTPRTQRRRRGLDPRAPRRRQSPRHCRWLRRRPPRPSSATAPASPTGPPTTPRPRRQAWCQREGAPTRQTSPARAGNASRRSCRTPRWPRSGTRWQSGGPAASAGAATLTRFGPQRSPTALDAAAPRRRRHQHHRRRLRRRRRRRVTPCPALQPRHHRHCCRHRRPGKSHSQPRTRLHRAGRLLLSGPPSPRRQSHADPSEGAPSDLPADPTQAFPLPRRLRRRAGSGARAARALSPRG